MKFKSAIYITNSIMIFMISCCLPAVCFKIGNKSFSHISPVEVKWGWEFLFFGPFGILLGVKSSICWAANIFYMISIIYLINDKFKLSVNFAIIALLAGGSFPLLSYYFPLPQDEGGVMHARFYKPQIGYFLWILSMAIMGATAYFEKCNQTK